MRKARNLIGGKPLNRLNLESSKTEKDEKDTCCSSVFLVHHASMAVLNLVVLRSRDLERAAAFYSRLGLSFAKHRHGNGPEHLSAELNGAVFELYPQASDGASTLGTRIGFSVLSVDEAVKAVSEFPEAVLSGAKDSEWGRRAVVKDPDGHRVELVQVRVK
jgi:lactoylglutathione lyase